MGTEIERKFLVTNDSWRAASTGSRYSQGYISTTQPGHSVRVRIAGSRAYLTIKGPSQGLSRAEFEYEIPLDDAQEMLETLCDRPLIEKTRYCLPIGRVVWEIDEVIGENAGLVVAEVELKNAERPVEIHEWIGQEVTGDPRFYNKSMVKKHNTQWAKG